MSLVSRGIRWYEFTTMFHQKVTCLVVSFALLIASAVVTSAQITIDGVTDKANYNDSVSYRIQTQAGFTYEA